MAQIARQETYKDVDFTFKQNPNTNDIGIKKNNESIKQSVLNILRTNHGERPFNYNFGANLRSSPNKSGGETCAKSEEWAV